MNLFLLTHTNDDGHNMDLVIQETSPERAADTWRDNWIENEMIDDTYFDGKLEAGVPTPNEDDVLRIFQIEAHKRTAGALGWHSKTKAGCCKLLGYVNP